MADKKAAEEDWEYASEDGEDYEWEYESEEEEEGGAAGKPKDKKDQDEDEEEEEGEEELDEDQLDELDLPDPFSSEPVPVVASASKDVPKSPTEASDDAKKKKHRKKSKHHDKFEKFRRLEEKEARGGDDHGHRKKIHVRSKDPGKIARQFEKGPQTERKSKRAENGKAPPRPPQIQIVKECKICGKEPYLVERIVAEKAWWHKNCFRCKECNKLLNLDTYASHQGVIYCKPHHKELFLPKPVCKDLTEEILSKNLDFNQMDHLERKRHSREDDIIERHRHQERRMETIVRESRPVELEGVIKSKVDDSKWDGLDSLDVGSKFLMFEKGGEEREPRVASDRYGIMEKLKRLQAGENVEDLLAEIDEEMPSDESDQEEEEEDGLTQVQRKAHNAEKLFQEDTKKEKLMQQRKKELKLLRDKLMAGTRDNIMEQFDEINTRRVKKTQVDVRSENAKKFMTMFNKGEIPESVSSADRITLEKEAELETMRSKKRQEREFFKKMENGELETKERKEPKLLVGKIKDLKDGTEDGNGLDPECATLSKKFSFFEHYKDEKEKHPEKGEVTERSAAARDCKARSVLNKFKEMEQKIANGEEVDDPLLCPKRPIKRFTPPRKLFEDSESEYSDSEYSDSEYTGSSYTSEESEDEEDEYLRSIREAARAKQLRAKFEEWEAQVGEDGGYTNLVDENGQPLESASKLKQRFERMSMEESEARTSKPRYQVKRFKPKEAYDYQLE